MRLGFPGTIGRTDSNYVRWEKCPAHFREGRRGKEGCPCPCWSKLLLIKISAGLSGAGLRGQSIVAIAVGTRSVLLKQKRKPVDRKNSGFLLVLSGFFVEGCVSRHNSHSDSVVPVRGGSPWLVICVHVCLLFLLVIVRFLFSPTSIPIIIALVDMEIFFEVTKNSRIVYNCRKSLDWTIADVTWVTAERTLLWYSETTLALKRTSSDPNRRRPSEIEHGALFYSVLCFSMDTGQLIC